MRASRSANPATRTISNVLYSVEHVPCYFGWAGITRESAEVACVQANCNVSGETTRASRRRALHLLEEHSQEPTRPRRCGGGGWATTYPPLASFSLGRLVRAARFAPTPQRAAHTISWDQAQVAAVLQKDLAGCLCRVDANAVVGDDGGCLHILLKLLGSVLEHGVERRRLWHLEHAVWQLRIRRERDLELHLHESADKPSALACGPLSMACGGYCLSERTLAAAAGEAFGASAIMQHALALQKLDITQKFEI